MNELLKLKRSEQFINTYRSLCKGDNISELDKELLLGFAMLLLKKYSMNEASISYFELAYHIVLKYSIYTKDYAPLNDISYNYGFFPIVRLINMQGLLNKISINDILYDYSLEKYKNESYIETLEQNTTRNNIMKAKGDVCFVAPTSSGKSSIISEHIKSNVNNKRTLIIVPSKSLLSQTYVDIRSQIYDRKIICHDEMYNGEDVFVGILTQERAMRLIERNEKLRVDCLYIDEAHNIFSNDGRSVILARMIKRCMLNNTNIKIIYLSPFIENINNLLLKEQGNFDTISEQRICHNIKEPDIYELKKNGEVFLYNRFIDDFWQIEDGYDLFSYLAKNSDKKNFIFLGSPKKIEQFAKDLYAKTSPIEETDEIRELEGIIAKYVHDSFMEINMIKHGIVYLHAKIPDNLKDYLEYQFKTVKGIRYLIANTVILEGINLPIDSLFVLDVRNQSNNKLLNLIGRVNRLNNVFDTKAGSINKLTPRIHFVNSKYYHGDMGNKIAKLYSGISDEVTNPLLLNCDVSRVKASSSKKEKIKKRNEEIVQLEHILYEESTDEFLMLKKSLIKSGMDQLVSMSDDNVMRIKNKIAQYRTQNDMDVIDIIKGVLVDGIEVNDKSFKRLNNEAAIRYYKHFINVSRRDNLKGQIESQYVFFRNQQRIGNTYMYIGQGFGECKGPYAGEVNFGNVYIDVSTKTDEELVNLLVVKTKIEQDFLNYQYMRAVNFLYDIDVITLDEYNLEVYGTTDKLKIELLKQGITVGLLKLLSEENQINNIEKDIYGNIQGNVQFIDFYKKSDDYTKFEIRKYIRVDF